MSKEEGVQELSQQKAPGALIRMQVARFLFRLLFMKMLSLTEDACPETGGFTFQNPKCPSDLISNKALKSPQKLRKKGNTHTQIEEKVITIRKGSKIERYRELL